jgi:hypothetical protein
MASIIAIVSKHLAGKSVCVCVCDYEGGVKLKNQIQCTIGPQTQTQRSHNSTEV